MKKTFTGWIGPEDVKKVLGKRTKKDLYLLFSVLWENEAFYCTQKVKVTVETVEK